MSPPSHGLSPTGCFIRSGRHLADTAGDLAGALNRLRAQQGLPPQPPSCCALGLCRCAWPVGCGHGHPPDHPDYESHRLGFLDAYMGCLAETTSLFDGMEGGFADIEARGLKWGVVTNKPHRFTVPVMAGLGLQTRAGVIISGDTTAHAKPHPLPLLTACEQLGVDPPPPCM